MHELIENIDIGGPTLIRAAAKNYQDVAVVASPEDYAGVLQELHESQGELSEPTLVAAGPEGFRTDGGLRSGHQRASGTGRRRRRAGLAGVPGYSRAARAGSALRRESAPIGGALFQPAGGIAGAEQLQGKELSYNNLVDLDAAWQLIQEFERARLGRHQAHQSLRMRRRRDAGRELPAGF